MAVSYVSEDITLAELEGVWNTVDQAKIIAAIAPGVKKVCHENTRDPWWTENAAGYYFLATLELVVESFRLKSAASNKMLPMFNGFAASVKSVYKNIQELDERADATANCKAQLFIEEISRCNKEGWPTNSKQTVQYFVTPSAAVKAAAVKFFSANEHLSVREVWTALSDCVEIHMLKEAPPLGQFDVLWHARLGIVPSDLFKHWDKIRVLLSRAGMLQGY